MTLLLCMCLEQVLTEVVGSYDNLLAKKQILHLTSLHRPVLNFAPVVAGLKMPETGEFKADYMTRALIPAIGVSYSFSGICQAEF